MRLSLAGLIGTAATLLAPLSFASVSVTTDGFVEENRLGVQPGTTSQIEFMLDPELQFIEPGLFVDPWRWHWNVSGDPWDWLGGFTVEIELKVPGPGPDPYDVLRTIAVYDDREEDMVMDLELGSRFIQELYFPEGTLDPKAIPHADTLQRFAEGVYRIEDPNGEELLYASVKTLHAVDSTISVNTSGKIQQNELDLDVGTLSETEFMLDIGLEPIEPGIFIDPWNWHWNVSSSPWDWLNGFIVEIELEIPLPGPDPGPYDVMRIIAEYDDREDDMVMGLELGSRFVQELAFPVGTLNKMQLPDAAIMGQFKTGSLAIFDPEGRELLFATVDELGAEDDIASISTIGKVEENRLEIDPGTLSQVDFMLDTALTPIEPGIFFDPWQWHWLVATTPWDWLIGFQIEIELKVPFPDPDPGPYDVLRTIAKFDDPEEDMVMGLELGSAFVQELRFPEGTLNLERLPDAATLSRFVAGSLEILSPEGEKLMYASIQELVLDDFIDSDGDDVEDRLDNCVLAANADQRDTDDDGFGNLCDADLDQDCNVNFTDLGKMASVFFSEEPNADLDGDGSVNFLDLGLLKEAFFKPPGPSGVPNRCDEFN